MALQAGNTKSSARKVHETKFDCLMLIQEMKLMPLYISSDDKVYAAFIFIIFFFEKNGTGGQSR